jgi:hypothetical protein
LLRTATEDIPEVKPRLVLNVPATRRRRLQEPPVGAATGSPLAQGIKVSSSQRLRSAPLA